MKLSKLYCNDPRFRNVTFRLHGLNVVYAEVRTQQEENKNSHDLGKTKLADLIDYLLLKKSDKRHNFLFTVQEDGVSRFQDHVFYLEVLLNSGIYLTLRRSVAENSKIAFALRSQREPGYQPPQQWEYEKVPLTRARSLLGEYLHFDFFKVKPYDYRKSIQYSLRQQGDYTDVYKLSKFNAGRDKDWKPFMFDLLGFNGQLVRKKFDNDDARKKIESYVEQVRKEYSIRVEDRDDVVAQIAREEQRARAAEAQIDRFNFYEQDKTLTEQGIEQIEQSISELNATAYGLGLEINRLENSISNKLAFDMGKVQKVFEESQLYFPDQLAKEYSDLVQFNNTLTAERNKLLRQSLTSKQSELQAVRKQLERLNEEREGLLSFLQDTDAFQKFKRYQKDLGKIEGKLANLRNQLETIDKVREQEARSEALLKEISDTIRGLQEAFGSTEKNTRYQEIRSHFTDFFQEIMKEEARISWKLNTNNNVEFVPPKVITDQAEKNTAKDEGNTYRKLLCVAFDLAILVAYRSESYYRFVYHDDVLSQEDDRIKRRLLALVRRLGEEYGLQYILSAISSDLPHDEGGNQIPFQDDEIILRLHDKDPSGTLFGFEF